MRSFFFVCALALAGSALAQSDPAADHYRAGVVRFKAGQYAEAIQEFRAADAIRPSAVLSFNIAQCFEKMADLSSAKSAYQDYLRRSPNADDRPAVEATISSIDQKLAQQQASSSVVLVPSTAEARAESKPGPSYTLGIATASVGGAALVAGVLLNLVSHQNSQSLQNDGLNNQFWPKAQAQSYHDNAANFWTGAIIGYAVGGVLLATGGGILTYQLATKPSAP